MDWLYCFRCLEAVVILVSIFRVLVAYGSETGQYKNRYRHTKEASKVLLSVAAVFTVVELLLWWVG